MSSNPSNLTSVTAKVLDDGAVPTKVFQPVNQVTFVTHVAVTTTYTTNISGSINSVIDALVAAGIMKSS